MECGGERIAWSPDGVVRRATAFKTRQKGRRTFTMHTARRHAAENRGVHRPITVEKRWLVATALVCRACSTARKLKSSPNLMEVKGSEAQGVSREIVPRKRGAKA